VRSISILRDEAGAFDKELWAFETQALLQNALALRRRVHNDAALVRGKLLLDWGFKASEPGSDYLGEPESISNFINDIRTISGKLAQINQGQLNEVAALSPHGDRYKAQSTIHQNIQLKLEKLQQGLSKRLPPDVATGSRATQARQPRHRLRP